MDVAELVTSHYGGVDVAQAVLTALRDAGLDLDHLRPADLAGLDQLHAGGRPAAEHVVDRLELNADAKLLDVGCGVGGPARIAAERGFDVTGVDLTADLVRAAEALTDAVGLAGHARFEQTSADRLPFDDASFDAAMMIHVGMNVPDKAAVFREIHRVLCAGSRFALYEQMRTGPGELPYPMPWADDERSSFVRSPEEYAEALESAGFAVVDTEDRTESTLGPPPTGVLSPVAVLGAGFAERVGNNIAATRAGLLGALLVLAER